ncbi:MAG: hypothetical protein AABX31_01660 [Nanoarchaeota archaeon]
MAPDEDFGYSLSPPEICPEDMIQDLREKIKRSKRYAVFHALEALMIPYFAERCSGKFSEPWDNVICSGLLLFEILAIGACLHSAYTWKKASSHLNQLEQKLFQEE